MLLFALRSLGQKYGRPSITFFVALSCALFFGRQVLFSGLTRGFGDVGDGFLMISLVEHWYLVVTGVTAWSDAIYFHPSPYVLGYTDTLLLFGPIHVFFRLVGFDMFSAAQLTFTSVSLVGFFGLFTLCRLGFRLQWILSLTGSVFFVIGNMMWITMRNSHFQLLGVWFLPWLVLVAILAYRWRNERGTRFYMASAGVGFGYGLIAVSTFYILWFFTLLLCFFGVAYLAWYGLRKGSLNLWSILPTSLGRRLFVLICFGVGLLPMALIYGPSYAESGGWDWNSVRGELVEVADLVNVSHDNLIWGEVLEARGASGLAHRHLGITPLLHGFLGLSIIYALVSAWRGKLGCSVEAKMHLQFLIWGTVSLGMAYLFLLEVQGQSLWRIVFELVPGGKSIRVPFRFNYVIYLLTLLLDLNAMQLIWPNLQAIWQKLWGKSLIIFILIVLLAEQVNLATVARMDLEEIRTEVASQAPTEDMDAFIYLRDVSRDTLPTQFHQYRAVVKAHAWGIPTLNGWSGKLPPDYTMLDTRAADFRFMVNRWIIKKKLWDERIFAYDEATDDWALWDVWQQAEAMELLKGGALRREAHALWAMEGFSGYEEAGVWINAVEATMLVPPRDQPVEVSMTLSPFLRDLQDQRTFHVKAEGKTVARGILQAEHLHEAIAFTLPASPARPSVVSFETDAVWRVRDWDEASPDDRTLGLRVSDLSFQLVEAHD